MSAAADTSAPPPPGRSGRLLALVRALIDYGKHLAATLRQHATANDTSDLACCFGTSNLQLILARIAQGLHRAGLLEARIVRVAPRLDAEPQPKPEPASRKPPAPASPAEPHAPAPRQPHPADTAPLLAALPTPEQIAEKVRRQSIGAILADICRDLGITRGHPLWNELHLATASEHGATVHTLDQRLAEAGLVLGVPTLLLA